MKREKIYVALVVCLSIISISLIGYIVYNHKKDNEVAVPENKNNNENSSEIDDKTSNNKKIIDIELTNNSIKEIESDTEKSEIVTYKIKVDNSILEIYYSKGYTYFDINGELSSVYTGDNSLLYSLQKYNNYVFVTLNCQCGIPAVEYVIDLDEKNFTEKLCSPSNMGMCNGYKYTELLSNQYLETQYSINYNTKNISINRSEKFNCKDYKNYSMFAIKNDYKECKDDTCKRRVDFCFPYID